MQKVGRAEADKLAGEEIHFALDKDLVKDLKGEPGPKEKVIAPFFNLVRAFPCQGCECLTLR